MVCINELREDHIILLHGEEVTLATVVQQTAEDLLLALTLEFVGPDGVLLNEVLRLVAHLEGVRHHEELIYLIIVPSYGVSSMGTNPSSLSAFARVVPTSGGPFYQASGLLPLSRHLEAT